MLWKCNPNGFTASRLDGKEGNVVGCHSLVRKKDRRTGSCSSLKTVQWPKFQIYKRDVQWAAKSLSSPQRYVKMGQWIISVETEIWFGHTWKEPNVSGHFCQSMILMVMTKVKDFDWYNWGTKCGHNREQASCGYGGCEQICILSLKNLSKVWEYKCRSFRQLNFKSGSSVSCGWTSRSCCWQWDICRLWTRLCSGVQPTLFLLHKLVWISTKFLRWYLLSIKCDLSCTPHCTKISQWAAKTASCIFYSTRSINTFSSTISL